MSEVSKLEAVVVNYVVCSDRCGCGTCESSVLMKERS